MTIKTDMRLLTAQTITASGNAPAFSALTADALEVVVDCSGVTGTTPSLTFALDYIDPNTGLAYPVPGVSFAAITAALATPLRVVVDPLEERDLQLSWVVSGTTPSFVGVSVTVTQIQRGAVA